MDKPRTHLVAEEVRRILNYNPETGIFYWKYRPECPKKWNTRRAGKVAGCMSRTGYININIPGHGPQRAHRLAWLYIFGHFPDGQIDHRNGIREDNRIDNLRIATPSDNALNKVMQKNNTSGFVGVSLDPQRKLWRARVSIHRVMHDIGFFHTPLEAHEARCAFIEKMAVPFAPADPGRKRYWHTRDGR